MEQSDEHLPGGSGFDHPDPDGSRRGGTPMPVSRQAELARIGIQFQFDDWHYHI
jgi:hypothetical protein